MRRRRKPRFVIKVFFPQMTRGENTRGSVLPPFSGSRFHPPVLGQRRKHFFYCGRDLVKWTHAAMKEEEEGRRATDGLQRASP